MTKCWKYWQIVSDFKYGNRECRGKQGFEGFCNWCRTDEELKLSSAAIESLKSDDWKIVDFYIALAKKLNSGKEKPHPIEFGVKIIPETTLKPAEKVLWNQPRDSKGRFLPPVPVKEKMDKFLDEVVLPKIASREKVTTEDVKKWVAKETDVPYKTRKERLAEKKRLMDEAAKELRKEFTSLPIETQENLISDLEDSLNTINSWIDNLSPTRLNVTAFLIQGRDMLYHIIEVFKHYYKS